jgi:hypothetical protein
MGARRGMADGALYGLTVWPWHPFATCVFQWHSIEPMAQTTRPASSAGLVKYAGGERGIRTPDRLLTYTRFPGVRLKPLIHLSGKSAIIAEPGSVSSSDAHDAAGKPGGGR